MVRKLSLSLLVGAAALAGSAVPAPGDARSAARRFEEARRDEPSLIAFLRVMPKGADLHNHAGGALYPEHGLAEAVRNRLYYNPKSFTFQAQEGPGTAPASRLLQDDRLRYDYYNAATMRGPVSGPAGGHDHFFDAFTPLGSPWQKTSREEAIATLVRRARLQNIQYLELMRSPGSFGEATATVARMDPADPEAMLRALRPVLPRYVESAVKEMDSWDRLVPEKAGTTGPLSSPDASVTVRYLVSAYRADPDQESFALWASAFEVMRRDPRVVGVNFVQPEDHPTALARFDPQMRLLDYLWKQFDRPNVTLHAGELNPTVAPMEDMTFHIRRSIEVGHARRIGHGVAVAWEDDAPGLLRMMRERGIAVEICPTSNAVILGVEGDRHPFQMYRKAGVPVTINTDDEAVLRSNLTLEYVRAVRSWNLSYADLKEIVRNGIEYSFLPGESLWESRDYRRLRSQYRGLRERDWVTNDADRRRLAASPRATVQARLERAFVEFER